MKSIEFTLPPSPGEKEKIFEKVAEEITGNGLLFHAKEHDAGGRDPKTYHTSEHPRTLEKRCEQIGEVLHLKPEELATARMSIAWHDTVIEYDKADPNNLLSTIRRHRGARKGDKPDGTDGNEAKSARLLEHEMREANRKGGQDVFTEEQIRNAKLAIEATYPDVDLGNDFKGAAFKDSPYYGIAVAQNPELGDVLQELESEGVAKGSLFFQPHLEKPLEEGKVMPREVLAVALVDLGAAGFARKEEFFKEGDDEMRELYANLRQPDIMNKLLIGDGEADNIDREKVAAEFIKWLDSQTGFAVWQALRFEKILHLLEKQDAINPEERAGLHTRFDYFTENIRAARDRAKELKENYGKIKSDRGGKEAFVYLVKSLHYAV